MRKNNDTLKISIIISLLVILMWYFAFNMLHYPKNYESIYIFYAGDVNDYSITDVIKDELNDNNIRSIEIVQSNPNDKIFESKYDLVCFNKCDIAIIPKDVADHTACYTCYEELTNYYGLDTYTQDSIVYGLILNDAIKDKLDNYFTFDNSEYILFVCQNSVNYQDMTNNVSKLMEWIVK